VPAKAVEPVNPGKRPAFLPFAFAVTHYRAPKNLFPIECYRRSARRGGPFNCFITVRNLTFPGIPRHIPPIDGEHGDGTNLTRRSPKQDDDVIGFLDWLPRCAI
jgi:hypothetical protein